MTSEIARLAMQFLLRPQTQIGGNEVPAFNRVLEELDTIANKPTQEPAEAPMRVVGGAA